MALSDTDFDVLSNWSQSTTGTITNSNSGATPLNYARNSTRVTNLDWEITVNPAGSNFTTNYANCGLSKTTTPTDKEWFQYCWLLDGTNMYWFGRFTDNTSSSQGSVTYVNGAIYSIKCVSGRVSFYEDDVLKEELDSDYDFDPTVITSAYVAAGQSQNNTTFVVQSDIGSSPPSGSGGTRLPPPPLIARF